MDETRAARQLHLIAQTVEFTRRAGIQVWLRGGWAMDFFLGEVTRDHKDIDWFAWTSDASWLARELPKHGYKALPGPPSGQQLDFANDKIEVSFALLDTDQAGEVVVAGGPWAGEPYPQAHMLYPHPGRIAAVRCPILSPRAQVEIKRMEPIWVPGRPRRQKDAEDIDRLEKALTACNG